MVRDERRSGPSWVAPETVTGRISLLSRFRKGLLAAGTVVVLGCFIAAAALLTGSDDDAGDEAQAAETDPPGRGIPTRVGPTELPGGGQFEEWAGPGCTTGGYREVGRFENGDAAWYTVREGGRSNPDCDGSFTAVPMSGSAAKDTRGTAIWSWELDDDYRTCALAVFVPGTNRASDAAGDPTFYRVLADPDDVRSGYTGFGVRQTVHRGELVSVRSYPVKGDKVFAVQLLDRGRDWGSAERIGAHHAAAQMKLTCGAA
ncbi:adhesin [Streptomyces sp. PKU-MA01144]|uniref:adhesin n=1 Tax=Streptomyces TaxID=1883 RepID=UPI001480CB2F|nr:MULTISPECIES: adhesin [Streptomyces]MCY0981620.1 adhesin [Streptomyces tirandamycinicus]NNJ03320.1 adhesin [Streptomyces sp. PKU-MA01144]